MVFFYYHTRLRTQVHHVGVHEHEKPSPHTELPAKRIFDHCIIGAPSQTPNHREIGDLLRKLVGDGHGMTEGTRGICKGGLTAASVFEEKGSARSKDLHRQLPQSLRSFFFFLFQGIHSSLSVHSFHSFPTFLRD